MDIFDIERTGTTIRVWINIEPEDFTDMTEVEATRLAEDVLDRDSAETIIHSDNMLEILFT